MNRSVVGWIIAFTLAIGGAAFAWLWLAGGSGEPSTELTTPTIPIAATTESDTPDTTDTSTGGFQSFVIAAGGESIASFGIDEDLRGTPQTVVGTTSEVAGQVQVDVADLSSAQFSEIVINARTFMTDSERRDRAIRGPVILNSASDEFEFVTFVPTSIEGLQGSLSPGETVEFAVVGDLTIRGTTSEAMFDVVATLVDATTIEGVAGAQVLRSDFGIGIPSVPSVANVSDEVILTLDFVANSG